MCASRAGLLNRIAPEALSASRADGLQPQQKKVRGGYKLSLAPIYNLQGFHLLSREFW